MSFSLDQPLTKDQMLNSEVYFILLPQPKRDRLASFLIAATTYSHLSKKRGAWNKRGGGAKVAKSLNVEVGINVEGGIFY